MSESKKPSLPYANTKASPEKTKAQISELLKRYGIQDIQWTSYRGEELLQFIHRLDSPKGAEIRFEIKPPVITARRRTWNVKEGHYQIINAPMWAQAWRLVYWYLETKLKAIEYGLATVEREFMSRVMIPATNVTLGDAFEKPIIEGKLALPEEVKQ